MWKEWCVTSEVLVGLLLWWARKLDDGSKAMAMQVLRGWLSKAVPGGDLLWFATTELGAARGGPQAEFRRDLWAVRVKNQTVCLNEVTARLPPTEQRALRRSEPE